jgi:acetyl-CoA carboxylase carboxyltransferase component
MALGGPSLVKMVTGEDIDEENLGGSKIHTEISGCADNEFPDDVSCIKGVKDYLSYMPSSNEEKPPRKKYEGDPTALISDEILDVLPDNPKQAYDMHKIIKFIVDDGEFFELKPKWARNIIVGFGRIGGYPVGIIANNPMFYGGVLDVNASDKAARFIWLCDAFNIPLVFLADVPGFMVSSKTEKDGLIRHGAKMIHAVAEASVPKFTVIIRKSYGAGYYAMCGKSFDPDIIVAWPTGEISVMGPEGMVSIFAKKQLEGMSPKEAREFAEQMAEAIRPYIDIKKPAGWGFIDDVIDPRETRRVLYWALELTEKKQVLRMKRKHGVYPV